MSLTIIETNDLEKLLRSVVRQELDARERPNEIMNRQQLSEYTGWSLSTITRKMKAGLPYFGGEGEHPRFQRAKVDEWLTKERSYL
jgi:predicted DNA-binding transcriptional regulator AlpA